MDKIKQTLKELFLRHIPRSVPMAMRDAMASEADEFIEPMTVAYQMGRASMLIETQMKESLKQFVGKETTQDLKDNLHRVVMERLRLYGCTDLEDSWQPQIDVVQDENDPTMIHILPKDERTKQVMQEMQQPIGVNHDR